MKRLIVIGFIAVVVCTGCGESSSSLDKSISQVEQAIDQMEKNKDNLSEEDWLNIENKVDEPMKVITDVIENGKCGVKGKMKIISLMSKWTTVVTEVGFREEAKARKINLSNQKQYEQN